MKAWTLGNEGVEVSRFRDRFSHRARQVRTSTAGFRTVRPFPSLLVFDGVGSRRLSDQCEFPRDSGFSGNGGGGDAIARWPGSRCSAVGALRGHRLHLTVFPRAINPGILAHLGDVSIDQRPAEGLRVNGRNALLASIYGAPWRCGRYRRDRPPPASRRHRQQPREA